MLEKIKQQEWYKNIFARFERKDFTYLIMYALVLLGGHILRKTIGFSGISEEESIKYQAHLVSFFAVLLLVIGIHYVVRTIDYIWNLIKRKFPKLTSKSKISTSNEET